MGKEEPVYHISPYELTRLEQVRWQVDAIFRATCTTLDTPTLIQLSTAHAELAFVIERATRNTLATEGPRG